MAFNSSQVIVKTAETVKTPDLSLEELEFLLHLLKHADLKGFQIELFYNLVIKIQNQYINKSKK